MQPKLRTPALKDRVAFELWGKMGEDDRLEGADLNFHLLICPQRSFAASGFFLCLNNNNSSKHLPWPHSVLHVSAFIQSSLEPYEVSASIIFILQQRKLRHREGKKFSQVAQLAGGSSGIPAEDGWSQAPCSGHF